MLFSKGLFGYKANEVDKHLADMENEHNQKIDALKDEIADFERINEQLNLEINNLKNELSGYQKAEKAVAEALIMAQIRAEAIEEDAKKKVDEIQKEAETELAAKRNKLDELHNNYFKARNEFEMIINKYRNAINELDNYESSEEES